VGQEVSIDPGVVLERAVIFDKTRVHEGTIASDVLLTPHGAFSTL
jgi:hypothetical protein